jgi:hypothetical protein
METGLKIGLIVGILAVFVLAAVDSTHTVFASECHASYNKCYNDGWNAGVNDAMYAWDNNQGYDPSCPSGHSDIYCSGYSSGYNHWWSSAQNNNENNQQTEQNANVKINGNNNKVTINQQSSNQVGSNDIGSDGSYHHSGAVNPDCRLLCLGVNIH